VELAYTAGLALALALCTGGPGPQSMVSVPAFAPAAEPAPAAGDWGDTFDANALDPAKWERFAFEGKNGGSLAVEGGQLKMRGPSGSRAGVRSTQEFDAGRIVVEAAIAKIGHALPDPGSEDPPISNAILTLLFDASGRNRIEWLLTREGIFEAWAIVNGNGSRLDNNNIGTKVTNPTLGVTRKGDEYSFTVNGQVGLKRTVTGLPRAFRVMLYGYGSSENAWDSVRVFTPTTSETPSS
jgi:hypothetical protein